MITETQAEKATKDFTEVLTEAVTAALPGSWSHDAVPSGNTTEGETGQCVTFEYDGHSFHVEVFGPMYEKGE
jgi:hypothetical protein